MAYSAIKTTELKAINTILSVIGEPPVSAPGTTDSTQAEAILQEVAVQLQSEGWWFNSRAKEYTTDSNKQIIVDDSVVGLDANSIDSHDYTIRNNKIFILSDNTNVFSAVGSTYTFDIIELLAWDDLPEYFRQYIIKKAGRILAQRYLPDSNVVRVAGMDEQEALLRVQREEMKSGNYSIFFKSNIGYPSSNILGRII